MATSVVNSYTYKCPKCGYIKTKKAWSLITLATAKHAPKCPKCGVKMVRIAEDA